MKEKKIYEKWWFWLICAFILLGILSMFTGSNCPECSKCPVCNDCSQCEADLAECIYQGLEMVDAWNDYVDALEEYCEIDYTNPLCLTIPK